MDGLALVVSFTALAVAVATLAVASRQLWVARTDAGGRGLAVRAYATGHVVTDESADDPTPERTLVVRISAAGPGVWHALYLYVGNPDKHVVRKPRFDFGDDPIEWRCKVPVDQVKDAWWMVTWLQPHAEGNRTEAIRSTFGQGQLECWRWKRPYRLHFWYEDTRRWWVPGSGRHRPLGRWKPEPDRHPANTQGPSIPIVRTTPAE